MKADSSKKVSVGKIILAVFLCFVMSLATYIIAVPFIYAVWHCPPPRECNTPEIWHWLVFAILLSPILYFFIGALFSRKDIAVLTASKPLRLTLFLIFALLPIFCFVGLIIYIVNSP